MRVAVCGLLGTFLLLSGCAGPFSTLDPAGPSARASAQLWWGMFGFSVVVMAVVIGLWLYAMRRNPGDVSDAEAARLQNRWILWGGFGLPLASITLLLAFGIPMGHSMLPLPPANGDAVRIDVTGHQWWWEVSYPDTGIRLRDEVHIPAGVPVDVHLTSADVIHAFWVPRLGGKLDAIPGRTNVLRLQADAPGTFRGQCAEFCGALHAHMGFSVVVHSPEEFADWLEDARNDD